MSIRDAIRGAALVVAALALAPSAEAQYVTPESGAYSNPSLNGSGFQIDFQDSVISLTFFGYNQAGQATFYFSGGIFNVNSRSYSGDLIALTNGFCIGCPFNPPVAVTIGQTAVNFTTSTTAVISLPRPNGGSAQIPVGRFSLGYGPNLTTSNLGAWFTSVIFSNDQPISDVFAISTTLQTPDGVVSGGRLYPDGQTVVGRAATLPGTTYNFYWIVDFSPTQNLFYGAEFGLEGFTGFSVLYPKGGNLPTTGTLSVGKRLAGINTVAQILGRSTSSESGKFKRLDAAAASRLAKQEAESGNQIVFSPETHAQLTELVRSLEREIPVVESKLLQLNERFGD